MKYVESNGDVRGTSANASYMGVMFEGLMDDAIAQAKAAPDHGVPKLNGRAELLAFLRVKLDVPHYVGTIFSNVQQVGDRILTEEERDGLNELIEQRQVDAQVDSMVDKHAHLGKWSLAYGIAKGWV